MFFVTISRTKRPKGHLPAVHAELAGAKSEHYQIFQDGHPLAGLSFGTKREAQKALRGLPETLVAQSYGWYHVELRRNGAIGGILGVRKHFDDGSTVEGSYIHGAQSSSGNLYPLPLKGRYLR